MAYQSTKTYGNDRGFSCAFRQFKADSHCNLIHGYSLGFRFVFEADELDERNWVYDFGNCKWIKNWLEEQFDHTLAVDKRDPMMYHFETLQQAKVVNLKVMNGVGCEKFAEHAFKKADEIVRRITDNRCYCVKCEVREHGANSGIYLSHK